MNIASLQTVGQTLAVKLQRFPLVILAVIVGAVTMIAIDPSDSETIKILGSHIGYTVAFAFPILVAAAYAGELFPRPRWFFQSAALLAIWVYWHFFDQENWGTFFLVKIAAVAIASAIPGLVANPKLNWWRVNIGLLNALLFTHILYSIVFSGLMLAVASLRLLFDLKLSGIEVYIMALCVFLVSPLAFVMLLPAARADLDPKKFGFAFWELLCQWALVPIGFLFTIIIAAHEIHILIRPELLGGMDTPMLRLRPDVVVFLPVLALGCYGLAVHLMIEPWRADRIWAKAFSWIFPMAFPLFSIQFFVILARRTEAIGFTPGHYVFLVLAVWVVAYCLVVLIRRSASPAFAPAILALLCLVAAFGPLSLQEVCLRSQTRLLEKLLANRSADNESMISSTLYFLVHNYDQSVVERFTGPLDLGKDPWKSDITEAARKKLGLPEPKPESN